MPTTNRRRRYRRPHRAVAILAAISMGCAATAPSTSLLAPQPVTRSIPAVGWIGKVEVTDAGTTTREMVAASMASSIRDYVAQGGYFRETKMLPGKPLPNDYILDFEFPHFQQRRSILPYYFPAAFLTLSLYIWFGGPIMYDELDLAGVLQIKSADGRVMAESQAKYRKNERKNLYSEGYMNPSSEKERTELIKKLLDDATTSLKGGTR